VHYLKLYPWDVSLVDFFSLFLLHTSFFLACDYALGTLEYLDIMLMFSYQKEQREGKMAFKTETMVYLHPADLGNRSYHLFYPCTRRIWVSCEVTFNETKVGIPGPCMHNFIALDLDELIPNAFSFTALLAVMKWGTEPTQVSTQIAEKEERKITCCSIKTP